ncbi:winged helix-turn-helix domain-containing protein [Roseobacter sp. MH60115]|uniref:winged helix-turn-helix domain-containing protein n=1 Tax=Roseobacter sp. MH60115 TaxID=2785324 RepID=UPI0018A32367|nr:winged helix-turn-helix domain-containing protein [Roseobacter sp. MH60115]
MILIVDGWRIDVPARSAERRDQSVRLSPRAIRFLKVFAEAPGDTIPRETLLDRVWPDVTVSDESLTQVVAELRRKLASKDLIATIPRGGYRLTVPILRDLANGPGPTHGPDGSLPIDAYALFLEARSCLARGDEGALRTFTALAAEAVARAPGDAEIRAFYATALLKQHIYWSEGATLLDAALTEAEKAVTVNPDNAETLLADGAARIEAGMKDAGLRAIARALSLARSDAGLHLEAAMRVMAAGDRRSAAALALRAAELAPTGFRGDQLAARYLERDEPDRARVHAERALRKVRTELEIDPNALRALYALGPLLAQLGDAHAARAALEAVPHHNSPLEYYRAVGFSRIGDVTAALERITFLSSHGWRGYFSINADEGFRAAQTDARFRRLHAELLSA